jgi:hypothetical protein
LNPGRLLLWPGCAGNIAAPNPFDALKRLKDSVLSVVFYIWAYFETNLGTALKAALLCCEFDLSGEFEKPGLKSRLLLSCQPVSSADCEVEQSATRRKVNCFGWFVNTYFSKFPKKHIP